jgi:cell division protein FtsI/penicillin-binding protein 2
LAVRLKAIKIVIIIALVLMALRLLDLQVLRHGQYQQDANQQLRSTISIPAIRGGIYDRNGAVLAMSVPTKEVIADDFQIAQPVAEATALAPLLGVSESTLVTELQRHTGYVVLASHLPSSKSTVLAKDRFPGITMIDSAQRIVPNSALGLSVIGLTNAQGVGAAGLEYQYQKLLAGTTGSTTLLETPFGVSVPQSKATRSVAAVPGTGVELTLDQPLQYVTEQALGAQIVATHALSGTAIVMDTRTGQILSMANLVATGQPPGPVTIPLASQIPSGITGVAQAQNNLAVTQTYEPGSVFKIVTFSAALESGQITPTTAFSVPNQVTVDGSVFHDAEQHGIQSMTAEQILAQSSNIGTYEIANQLGENQLLAQVERLGFGQQTGLSFPGESSGLLMNAARWEPTDLASLPIGQVDAVTPMQVLDAYNAVANGGTFVAPQLVRANVASDGHIAAAPASASHRVMSSSTASTMNTLLQEVISGGTGAKAAIPGYLVAGKTGTAQIPSNTNAGYLSGAYNATFVGFAPADHPVLSAIVVLQRPSYPDYFGGDTAAPVFAKIMSYALHRYGVPTSPGGSGSQTAAANTNSAAEST